MVFKTKIIFILCIFGIIFISLWNSQVNSQSIEYSSRVRNVTVISETNSICLTNLTIFRNYTHHRTFVKLNLTTDIISKHMQVVIFRCVYEKWTCENFQKWSLEGPNLKNFLYMKNQMWSPIFANFRPPIDLPTTRKGIYVNDDFKFDAKAALAFYSEAADYYYQIEVTIIDSNNKKAEIMYIDTIIHKSIARDLRRNFRNASRKSTSRN